MVWKFVHLRHVILCWCAGIKRLQSMLLKISLLLGVDVQTPYKYLGAQEPDRSAGTCRHHASTWVRRNQTEAQVLEELCFNDAEA